MLKIPLAREPDIDHKEPGFMQNDYPDFLISNLYAIAAIASSEIPSKTPG